MLTRSAGSEGKITKPQEVKSSAVNASHIDALKRNLFYDYTRSGTQHQVGSGGPLGEQIDHKVAEIIYSASTKKEFSRNLYEYFMNNTDSSSKPIDKQSADWDYFKNKTNSSDKTIDEENNVTDSTIKVIHEQNYITTSPGETIDKQNNISKDTIDDVVRNVYEYLMNGTGSPDETIDEQDTISKETTDHTVSNIYKHFMNETEYPDETIHKQDTISEKTTDYTVDKPVKWDLNWDLKQNVAATIEKQREIWTEKLPEPLTRILTETQKLQVALQEADKLVSWSPEASVEVKIENWQKEHSGAPTRNVDFTDDWADTFQRFKIELGEHRADLYQMKKYIEVKAGKLFSEPPLVYDSDKAELLKQGGSLIKKIKEAIGETEETLQMVMEYYPKLVELKPEHPRFFKEKDRLTPHQQEPTIEFLPRQSYPAGNLARTLRAYFQAHNTDGKRIIASEKHIAEALEADPLGDRIEVTKLDRYDTTLSDLGDTKGLEFWKIQPQEIDLALRYGPIIAFPDTSQAAIPSEGYYPEGAVIVSHIEKDIIEEDIISDLHDSGTQVVASDESEGYYKIPPDEFAEEWIKQATIDVHDSGKQVVILDESAKEGYYKIPLRQFAEEWKGGVLLPRQARADLEFIT